MYFIKASLVGKRVGEDQLNEALVNQLSVANQKSGPANLNRSG